MVILPMVAPVLDVDMSDDTIHGMYREVMCHAAETVASALRRR